MNPNDGGQSQRHRACFCSNSQNENSKFDIPNPVFNDCHTCFQRANLETQALDLLNSNVRNYCQTDLPSYFLFLWNMISFLKVAKAPNRYQPFRGPIWDITTLANSFTMVEGMNEVRDFPYSLLAQLPSNWPYTTNGIARKERQSTTWPLTAEDGMVEAVVLAWLQWWPRPLGRQRGVDVRVKMERTEEGGLSTVWDTMPFASPSARTTRTTARSARATARTTTSRTMSTTEMGKSDGSEGRKTTAGSPVSSTGEREQPTSSEAMEIIIPGA